MVNTSHFNLRTSMSGQTFASPFDFPSPFSFNQESINPLVHAKKTLPHSQAPPPPSYEAVVTGSYRNPVPNPRGPPPGLGPPPMTQNAINNAILQALRNELSEAKSQLVVLSKITEKIESIEKLLYIFENCNKQS